MNIAGLLPNDGFHHAPTTIGSRQLVAVYPRGVATVISDLAGRGELLFRVGFDTVARLVTGGVAPNEVQRYYPSVSAAAVQDAADLYCEMTGLRGQAE